MPSQSWKDLRPQGLPWQGGGPCQKMKPQEEHRTALMDRTLGVVEELIKTLLIISVLVLC